MPDLAVHTLTTYIINKKLKRNTYFILLGSIFPDIIGRMLIILSPQNYTISWICALLHTPTCVLLAIYLTVMLAREERRREYFVALATGAFFHFLADATQKHFGNGYYWLFPFSFRSWELPLLWPDQYFLTIPLWILLALVFR